MGAIPTPKQVMERLCRVPDASRSFAVPAGRARTYGIGEDLLAELDQLGLPRRVQGGEALYDGHDLSNVGLHLRLRSLQRMAMRTWNASLARLADRPEARVELAYVLEEPHATQRMGQPMRMLAPGQGRVDIRPDQPRLLEIEYPVRSALPPLPAKARELVRGLDSSFTFFMLHESVRWNLDLLRSTGMAECGGASKELALRARAAGLEVRHCFGLILAEPYSSPHYWVEFRVEGAWVPSDPLMLQVLGMVGLPRQDWPPERSPGAILLPLTEVVAYEPETGKPVLAGLEGEAWRITPLVTVPDADVPLSIPTRIIAP